MTNWYIDDYAVPYLLRINGYTCARDGVSCWYWSNVPLKINGSIALDDGFMIEAHGRELHATKKDKGKR